jgi:hypothetical protein
MSEEKSALDKVEQEYIQVCVQIGNAFYAKTTKEAELKEEITSREAQIDRLLKQAKKLNKRGAYLKGMTPTDESEERDDVEGTETGNESGVTDSNANQEPAAEPSVPASSNHH